MKNLNICFIGCGDHANRFVYPSLANCPGTTLQAVCALDAAQAEENRKRHGANRAYTDYKEMILTEQPDAVIIIGPPRLHYEAGLFCADRKIPFYMEKPCGENPQQAEELCNAARKNGVFGQVGFMMRHSAVVREIARIEAENELGGLNYGTVKYFTSGPYRSDEIYGMPGLDDQSFLWRYLMVQAVHPVNLAASFLGEIAAIDSEIRFSGENLLVDIRLTDTDNRRMNALLHTFVAPGYGNLKFETELFYNNRSMIFTDAFRWTITRPLPVKTATPVTGSSPTSEQTTLKWDMKPNSNISVTASVPAPRSPDSPLWKTAEKPCRSLIPYAANSTKETES